MPQIDILEQAFIAVTPERVAAYVRGGTPARLLWPGLEVRLDEDRGIEGQRYLIGAAADRQPRSDGLHGTAEIWLEATADGVVAHVFLRADPPPATRWSPRRAHRCQDRWRRHIRFALWAIKDDLEGDRRPGEPAVGAARRTAIDN